MALILDLIVPARALRWDYDRPFCRDSHIWSDWRLMSLNPIRDLLPSFTASRGQIMFVTPPDFVPAPFRADPPPRPRWWHRRKGSDCGC